VAFMSLEQLYKEYNSQKENIFLKCQGLKTHSNERHSTTENLVDPSALFKNQFTHGSQTSECHSGKSTSIPCLFVFVCLSVSVSVCLSHFLPPFSLSLSLSLSRSLSLSLSHSLILFNMSNISLYNISLYD